MVDKYLAESHGTVSGFPHREVKILRGEYFDDHKYHSDEAGPRYQVTPSGVSPRMLPGKSKVIFNVASDEHDESGAINEDQDNRIAQMNKRMKKMHELTAQIPKPIMYGPAKAEITLIAWGSTKGPVLDALDILHDQGIQANFMHLVYLHPFPVEAVKTMLSGAKHTMIIEGNYSGQAEAILKQETLHSPDYRYRRYDGRPFYADDIVEQVRQALSHGYKR